MVVIRQSGCIPANVVVLGQNCFIWEKWLNSGKGGCIRAKVVVFLQSGCIRAKKLVFGKKWLYSDKSGSIFGKSSCVRPKVVVFGQK